MKKTKIYYLTGILFLICSVMFFYNYYDHKNQTDFNVKLVVNLTVKSNVATEIKLYYKEKKEYPYNEGQTISKIVESNKKHSLTFELPSNAKILRLDLGEQARIINIDEITVKSGLASAELDLGMLLKKEVKSSGISSTALSGDALKVTTTGEDPFFLLGDIRGLINELKHNSINNAFQVALPSVAITAYALLLLRIINSVGYGYLKGFTKDIITSRGLILKLSKNDFNARYKGSFFGVTWAIVSPLLTVLVYWFVFQVGFKTSNIEDVPFILWFIPGIIPWFYFSEALGAVTGCFMEYSYLVKKMVFKINILPIVKLLSLTPINLLFVVIAFIFYFAYGNGFHFSNLQIFYYYFCLLVLSFSITLVTSSIMIFFKDLSQVIGIFLQFGFWLTPIVWNMNIISPSFIVFFKLNPLIYIVDGFRDTFIYHQWFFDKPYYTLYFWLLNIFILFGGILVFKKLKPHFSDVL
ncbi:ABC transporter permease [Paenibacillus sp. Mc5Re-14]|uniref:ABC transporter permease n=1 Tax=Paenibacillus sp. Mc5Re-14 TaxID=1030529 RepID=UPI000A4E8827|nr:ABC transporter permease [Paenibacillus sp. Mc5Re-14]